MTSGHHGPGGRARLNSGCIVVSLFISLILCTGFSTGCGTKPDSPDGKTVPDKSGAETELAVDFLVFERDSQLYRAGLDGSGERAVTSGFDTEPAVSADGKRIAYVHREADPGEGTQPSGEPLPESSIYVAGSDGSEPERLTPAEWGTSSGWEPLLEPQDGTVWVRRDCNAPSFSQDGSRIVFVLRDHAYQEIEGGGMGSYGLEAIAVLWIEGPREGELEIVARTEDLFGGGSLSNPKFSSDGSLIYFNELPGGGPPASMIVRTGADGSGRKVIADFEIASSQDGVDRGYYAFDLSPADGSIAAVELSLGGAEGMAGRIIMMDADGSNRSYVATGSLNVHVHDLCFSPDGSLLAFSTLEAGREDAFAPNDIYVVGTDGSGLKKVVSDGQSAAWGQAVGGP